MKVLLEQTHGFAYLWILASTGREGDGLEHQEHACIWAGRLVKKEEWPTCPKLSEGRPVQDHQKTLSCIFLHLTAQTYACLFSASLCMPMHASLCVQKAEILYLKYLDIK